MFSRRLFIPMLSSLSNEVWVSNTLYLLISVYLILKIICNPFKNNKVNILDSSCLLCLLFVLAININIDSIYSVDDDLNGYIQ